MVYSSIDYRFFIQNTVIHAAQTIFCYLTHDMKDEHTSRHTLTLVFISQLSVDQIGLLTIGTCAVGCVIFYYMMIFDNLKVLLESRN